MKIINAMPLIGLMFLANTALATSLRCDSSEYGPDKQYVVTISSDQKTADLNHPEVGERAEMFCKTGLSPKTNELVIYCDDEEAGDDTVTSIDLSKHPVSKRMMGNLSRYVAGTNRIFTLATLTCIEK